MFTIKFPDSNDRYDVPLACLEKHSTSFFIGIYHFKQQTECTITIHTYEELAIVIKVLNDEPIDLKTYIKNRKILDYYGVTHDTYDMILRSLKLYKEIKINWFDNFMNNKDEKIVFIDNIEQYFSCKTIFQKEAHIVPFQLLMNENIDGAIFITLLSHNGYPIILRNNRNKGVARDKNRYIQYKEHNKN